MNWPMVRKIVAIIQLLVTILLFVLKIYGYKVSAYVIFLFVITCCFLFVVIIGLEEKQTK